MVIPQVRHVRFLVSQEFKFRRVTYHPWRMYRVLDSILLQIDQPWEEIPKGQLKIGRRISQMITAIGLQPKRGGCCSGCTDLEALLNYASDSWIMKYRKELAREIKENARAMDVNVPQRIIEATLVIAVTLERRKAKERLRNYLDRYGDKQK